MEIPLHCIGKKRRGFTLIELLIVILIIGILTLATAPLISSAVSAMNITRSGQMLAGMFKTAHMYAITHNKNVEVRFYSYADASPSSTAAFRAVQLLEITGQGTNGSPVYKAVTKATILPSGIIMLPNREGVDYSNLLDSSLRPPNPVNTPMPVFGADSYTYTCFVVQPDGGTNLPSQTTPYYVTVASENLQSAPKNFFTVQIDSKNSRVLELRP